MPRVRSAGRVCRQNCYSLGDKNDQKGGQRSNNKRGIEHEYSRTGEEPPRRCDAGVPYRKDPEGTKSPGTGASSGIGKGIAIALGQAGADVVVNYVSGEAAALEVIYEIRRCGRQAYAHQADVSHEDQVQAMFQHTFQTLGTIDILVNDAGLQQDAPFEDMTLAQWNTVINVNLTGQFLCARGALREFKRRGVVVEVSCASGKIICISSVHEVIPWAGHVNYAASKAGVMLIMKSIAQEVAPYRIRVNSISQGAIRTPINTDVWSTSEAYNELVELVPYNRIGEVDDIGRTAVWLASATPTM